MSQPNKPALVTDMAALIRGASEKPAPMVIGEKQDVIERTAPKTKPAKGRAAKPKTKPAKPAAPEKMPWDEANEKIIKLVQVRMPETLHAKLSWIKANSIGSLSVHDLMLTAISDLADKRIEQIKRGNRAG